MELRVLLKDVSQTTTLWWLSGNHGDMWQHGEVLVGRVPADFTVLFEASRNVNERGHVSIDDVSFSGCSLPGTLAVPPDRSEGGVHNQSAVWLLPQTHNLSVPTASSPAATAPVWTPSRSVTSATTVGTGPTRTAVVSFTDDAHDAGSTRENKLTEICLCVVLDLCAIFDLCEFFDLFVVLDLCVVLNLCVILDLCNIFDLCVVHDL